MSLCTKRLFPLPYRRLRPSDFFQGSLTSLSCCLSDLTRSYASGISRKCHLADCILTIKTQCSQDCAATEPKRSAAKTALLANETPIVARCPIVASCDDHLGGASSAHPTSAPFRSHHVWPRRPRSRCDC